LFCLFARLFFFFLIQVDQTPAGPLQSVRSSLPS
jgi:hypothetical protein